MARTTMHSFTEHNVPDVSGRTYFVTGANTGLGFETSRVLAQRGARVLLGCRSTDKAQAAIERIRSETPSADLEFVALDQADLASVRAAAERVAQEKRLDVLVNNAGIMIPPKSLTKDGFESQLGVNHLGTFALTGLLLAKLNEQAQSRVVITSSLAHRGAQIRFDDLNADQDYKAMERYKASKLANLLFMHELNRRLQASSASTLAVACHPGLADTELSRHFPKWIWPLAPIMRPFLNTAASGAWPTLMATTHPQVTGGDYFGPGKRGETAGPATRAFSSSKSKSEELGQRLWEVSVEMTCVDPGI